MAQVVPAAIPATVKSGAERELFPRLREQLGDQWTVLHSLGLTTHDRKPWAEIDFVLIGPPGVFCLEVKGGRIERIDGRWHTTPLKGSHVGQSTQLKESPFEQVASASAALFEFLRRRVPTISKAVTGYAVALPDCVWQGSNPDVDSALIYDATDGRSPFGAFMERIEKRWDAKVGSGWNRKLEQLTRGERAKVVDAMRGDFALVPSLRAQVDQAGAELVRFTEEQAKLFDRLANNSRVIARGGAGTGKTLIAVAEAKRLAATGSRTLFVCYSRNLALHIGKVLDGTPGVDVMTLHALMAGVVSSAGRIGDLPDAEPTDLFGIFYPELAAEVLLEHGELGYEAMIVDEGQDLLSPPHLDVLDLCLSDGLEKGTWRWFLDPNQNIFGGMRRDGMGRLLGAQPTDWQLTTNCRNTRPIAIHVALLSGSPLDESLEVDGPKVEQIWYGDREQERSELAKRLRKLLNEGTHPNRVVVLSPRRREASAVAEPLSRGLTDLFDISRGRVSDAPEDQVLFSTIASFKGLEADAVFLLDIDDLESERALASVYVGTSRAKALLFVFLDESARGAFGERARLFGERIASVDDQL